MSSTDSSPLRLSPSPASTPPSSQPPAPPTPPFSIPVTLNWCHDLATDTPNSTSRATSRHIYSACSALALRHNRPLPLRQPASFFITSTFPSAPSLPPTFSPLPSPANPHNPHNLTIFDLIALQYRFHLATSPPPPRVCSVMLFHPTNPTKFCELAAAYNDQFASDEWAEFLELVREMHGEGLEIVLHFGVVRMACREKNGFWYESGGRARDPEVVAREVLGREWAEGWGDGKSGGVGVTAQRGSDDGEKVERDGEKGGKNGGDWEDDRGKLGPLRAVNATEEELEMLASDDDESEEMEDRQIGERQPLALRLVNGNETEGGLEGGGEPGPRTGQKRKLEVDWTEVEQRTFAMHVKWAERSQN